MSLWCLALKDLTLLWRDRVAAFFILGFPVFTGLFFGSVMGGGTEPARGGIALAVTDLDQSELSRRLIESLKRNEQLEVTIDEFEAARQSVRKGSRVGMLVILPGFSETAGLFWLPPPTLQLGVDPSRTAERAMLEGMVMQGMGQLVQFRLQNSAALLPDARESLQASPDLDPVAKQLGVAMLVAVEQFLTRVTTETEAGSASSSQGAATEFKNRDFKFVDFEVLEIADKTSALNRGGPEPRSKWDISFPQAMLWGVLGCVSGFAVSIARERTQGTWVRLLVSPRSLHSLMLGKALACFLAALFVMIFLAGIGWALEMRPDSWPKLMLAMVCTAFCFVGIMMTVSVLGRTEQSVGGIGWSLNLVMAIFGGCMVPVIFMPSFVQTAGAFSPVRWSILAIEGAIWRDYSWMELSMPCGILLLIGLASFGVGSACLARQSPT